MDFSHFLGELTRRKRGFTLTLRLLCVVAFVIGNSHTGMASTAGTLQDVRQAVAGAAPVADFSGDVLAGEAPLAIHFRDQSTGGATAWGWDWGDGSTSSEQNPGHVYSTPGRYTIGLTVSNAAGANTAIKKNYVIVNSPPSPFTATDRQAEAQEAALEKSLGYVPAAPTPQTEAQAATTVEPNPPTLQSPANGAANVASPAATLTACVSDPDSNALAVTFYGRDISPISVPDFTLVALPDTQNYYSSTGVSAPSFLAQVQWILSNRVSRNIPFVTQLGDLVNDGSIPGIAHADAQWATADNIMRNLEEGIEALLDGVPYGIAPGNHDEGTGSKPNPLQTELYNKYFGISRFAGRAYYGGHYGTDNDNHYELFSVGDLKFVIIHMEYDTSSRPAVYAWADSVLKAYPDRWGIVTMHELIGTNGAWHPQGSYAWNGVNANPNLFLMLAGHVPGEGRRQDFGYHGNVVNTLMSDYQSRPNGGDGWFRYMEFSAASSEILVNTYSVTRNEYELDADSFFKVAFDSPSNGPLRRPFQIIARQTNVPNGSCPTATWSGLTVNHQYEWYVGVSDSPTDAKDVQTFSNNRSIFSTGNVATPAVKFSSASYTADEGSGTASVTVTLNQTSASNVTVNYATSNGTATVGSDYTATSGTLTFNVGETSKTFTVPVTDDSLDEANETINLTLSSPNNAVLDAPVTATLTITDNDNPPSVQFSSASYSVGEKTGTATFTVTLSAASGLAVTVNYATSNGTATAGSDYTATSGTLTFSTGQLSKNFTVPILPDSVVENNETVNLALTSPGNATLSAPAVAVLTIVNGEGLPTVQFSTPNYKISENGGVATATATLSLASTLSVTVNYASSNGTASAGSDYTAVSGTVTFNPGETTKNFTVPILPDGLHENDETLNLALTNPGNATLGAPALAVLTITDDDNPPTVQFSSGAYSSSESSGVATVVANLSAASGITVTVHYASNNGTALAGSDYTADSGLLIFKPGETSKSFVIPILPDLLDENDETINLLLTDADDATMGAPAFATLTIVDDDNPPTVQFSNSNYTVGESGGTATVMATLSAASSFAVTVHYVTSNGTATAGSDYGATSGTLSFTPGQTSQSFTVPVTDDSLDEANETINLTLSNPGQATLGALATATVTLVDDDNPPLVRFGNGNYSVGEQGGTAPITVQLSGASGLPVTVHYATSNGTATAGSDYAATSGTLTFNPGQTSQSFGVPIVQDSVAELNETVNLALSNPGQATVGTPATAVLTIVDDDIPAATPIVQFSAATYTYAEASGLATFTVTLSAASEQAVTVAYATADGTAVAGSDYTAANGVLTFAAGQTSQSFTLPLLDDGLDEEDETVILSLSQATGAILVGNTSATLTIGDDDAPPLVQFGAATYTVTTDSPVAVLEVKLSVASGKVVTVHYTTTTALAVAGATAGTVQFNPGETSQTVTIPLVPTGSAGPATHLMVALEQAANATVGGMSATTVEISAASSAKIYLPLVTK